MATQTRSFTGDSGVSNAWTASGGGSKFSDIATNDGDTSYNSANGANLSQLFTFSAATIPDGSTSISVAVVYVGRRTSTSLTISGQLRVNGTTYAEAGSVPGSTYGSRTATWATNPDTGAAWTVADANGTGTHPLQQAGFSNTQTTAGEEARVTEAHLLFTYTPPPTVPPIVNLTRQRA